MIKSNPVYPVYSYPVYYRLAVVKGYCDNPARYYDNPARYLRYLNMPEYCELQESIEKKETTPTSYKYDY